MYRIPRLRSFGPYVFVAAITISSFGCANGGAKYVGRWECSSGGRDFFEIKANSGAFLLTDETGATYAAQVDEKGTLVVSGVPLLGTLPLPIDETSGELISSASTCKRFTKKPR